MVARIGLRVHRLDAGGVIDVGNRRNVGANYVELINPEQSLLLGGHATAAVALHVGDQQHIRAVGIEFEIIGDVLTQD